ncbi:MAG: TIGR02391 family protein [Ornithinimicrobium sp.]
MNKQWAEEKLKTYLDMCQEVKDAVPPGDSWNDRASYFNHQAELMLGTVTRIVRELDPADMEELRPPSYGMSNDTEFRVRRALGILRDSEEIDRQMAPDAPELVADQLHPRVWSGASTIWDTGEYRLAVAQAALALSTHIKARAGSKLTDGKLVADALSPEQPKPGLVRLQFPGDRDDETWRSRQRGLHMLAQGAYAGIRNVSTHEDEPLLEHAALEYLAVLSVIARWVEETEAVRG